MVQLDNQQIKDIIFTSPRPSREKTLAAARDKIKTTGHESLGERVSLLRWKAASVSTKCEKARKDLEEAQIALTGARKKLADKREEEEKLLVDGNGKKTLETREARRIQSNVQRVRILSCGVLKQSPIQVSPGR